MKDLFGDEIIETIEEIVKEKKISLWDHIASLTNTKTYADDLETYVPFIVNRALGAFPELLYHVDRMNEFSQLPVNMQYDYYFHTISSKKRWKSWPKKEKNDDEYEQLVQFMMKQLCVSRRHAEESISLLREDQIEKLYVSYLRPDKNGKIRVNK